MLVYKVNLLNELKKKGYTTYRLTVKADGQSALIGATQLQKIREGKVVGINVLETILDLLDAQPGDIIERIPDDKYKVLYESGYFEKKGIPVQPPKDTQK